MTTELRPYQSRDVDSLEAELERSEKGVLYVAPTGSGKTVTFVDIVRRWAERGRHVNVEVHRRELMKQASRALSAAGVPHGLIAPEYGGLTTHLVHVSSVDTLNARSDRLRHWLNSIDLYVRDEAHHSTADNRRKLRELARRAKLLGPTATPYRADGAGLGDEFDCFVSGPSAGALVRLGWLAPIRAYHPKVPLSLKGVRKQMGDWAKGELAAAMMHNSITDPVVKFHLERARGRPTVVFCVSVEHAAQVAERFRVVGGLRAVAIDGSMRGKGRTVDGDLVDQALAGLASGTVDAVVSCQLIDEGLDVPRVACGVDLRPTLSTGRLLQCIGRTRRIDEEFEDALWIDAVGNLRDHGMPDEVRPWSLLAGVKNLERSVARPMTCQRCRRIQAMAPSCVECGVAFVQMPAAPAQSDVPGTLLSAQVRGASREMLLTLPMPDLIRLCVTDADLRHVGQIRGYKRGWAEKQIELRAERRGGGPSSSGYGWWRRRA